MLMRKFKTDDKRQNDFPKFVNKFFLCVHFVILSFQQIVNILVLLYLARHVVTAQLKHLQLVQDLLEMFGTHSGVFVQLG